MSGSVKLTRVAAAVIERQGADGVTEFLLGQRAPGTFYPGYWEFPGGKVEAGETPHQALVRELEEELGIRVIRAHPWLMRCHVYEHAHVELNFFRVVEWDGELCDHVHTALAWQRASAFTVSPMLPANGPILKALALPDFCAVTHAHEIGVAAQLEALAAALERGLKLVQIREGQLDPATRADCTRRAVSLCHQHGALVLINGDPELARACGADGIHLSSSALMATTARPDFEWVAASCHDAAELARAEALGLDFALVGSIRPGPSHPELGAEQVLGWEGMAALIERSPLPIFAIGGVKWSDLETAQRHRAHGLAAIRAAWDQSG